MSKSLGNVVDPEAITEGRGRGFDQQAEVKVKRKKKAKGQKDGNNNDIIQQGQSKTNAAGQKVMGVDVLRLWTCAHASQSSAVPVSANIFLSTKQELDRIRLIFRFLLGNLKGGPTSRVNMNDMLLLDQYVLNCLREFATDMVAHYESMQFNLATLKTLHFVANDLSADYFHLIKDR